MGEKIMKSIRISIIIILVFSTRVMSQDISGWKNYSDMKIIFDGSIVAGNLWAATEGGVFSFNFSDSSYKSLTKTEGLNGSPITALAVDNQGKVWLGSQNGVIDIYNPVNKSIKRILDIHNSGRSLRQVNSFRVQGDLIFVATSFGLSIINAKDYNFIDTYLKFGNLSTNISVNSSFQNNVLYVPTELGLAVQIQGSTNLSAPESWNVFTQAHGLPSNNILKAALYKNELIVSSDRGFAKFNGLQFVPFLAQFNQQRVMDFYISGDSIFILIEKTISAKVKQYLLYSYINDTIIELQNNLPTAAKIIVYSSGKIYLATSAGVMAYSQTQAKYLFPNGPQSNLFMDMSIDKNGKLWVASGTDVSGNGFYTFDGNTWQNFNTSNTPALTSNSIYNVYASSDNNIYLGSFGGGFVRIKSNNELNVFNTQNTGMVGTTKTPTYLVIPGLRTDSKKNLWILNHDAANKKTLSVLTPDSIWYHYANPSDSGLNIYTKLLIDQYDTKWYVSSDPRNAGLFYFNENKTFSNTADDKFGFLTQTSGLNSSTITSLAIDKRGDLWIGTNLGVNVITNAVNAIGTTQPAQFRTSSVFSLRQYSINCIAVDAINRKWIGTNQGVIVVSPDGSNLIAAFDTKNSPLVSDAIKSIAIDDPRGIVYIGVDGGLTSVQTAALLPKESFDELFIFPSPFILNSSDNNILSIDGLIRDTDIKILSISGKLIKEFSSPGGRIAYWDAKDDKGNLVNTGVYIIVAYDKEGNNISSGKVAVIRK